MDAGKEEIIQEIIEGLMRLQRPMEHGAWRMLGLSHAQVGMLYMLCYHENTSFKQIALNLDVSVSAVTQLIDPLLQKGLVSRLVNPSDRRTAKLSLTPKGKNLLKKFRKRKTEGLRVALRSLDSKELAQLAKIQQKMAAKQYLS
jgi:DNA-binding MarR family transcriptional regulator